MLTCRPRLECCICLRHHQPKGVCLKPRDHIVRINNESTINMTLQEAVDRLRGEVGTPVDV